MPQNIQGSFRTFGVNSNATSDVLAIQSSSKTARLNLYGVLDGSESVKAQKSLNSGQTWVDQATYTVPQVNTSFTVAHGEQWRLAVVGIPTRAIGYSLSAETAGA